LHRFESLLFLILPTMKIVVGAFQTADGGFIEADSLVEVVDVQGTRVVVNTADSSYVERAKD